MHAARYTLWHARETVDRPAFDRILQKAHGAVGERELGATWVKASRRREMRGIVNGRALSRRSWEDSPCSSETPRGLEDSPQAHWRRGFR